jgi:hypothetical protein
MESSCNGETRDRLKLVRMCEDLHHDLCSFTRSNTIVHEIRRGEIHEVVVRKENGHIIGSDTKTSGIGIGIGHCGHQTKVALDKLFEDGGRHHIVAGGAYKSVAGYLASSKVIKLTC